MTQDAINQSFIQKVKILKNKKITYAGIASSIGITVDKLTGIRRGNNVSGQLLEQLDSAFPELFKKENSPDPNPTKVQELEKEITLLKHNVETLIKSNKEMSKDLEEVKKQLLEERQELKKELEELRKQSREGNNN